ncbi:MAG: hypothetical protein QM758_10870 [Armatimonas sp.]
MKTLQPRTLLHTVLLAATISLTALAPMGCGSGNSLFGPKPDPIETSTTATPQVTINWPQLGRALDAPTSARSVRITIKRASTSDQSDVSFIANRDEAKNGAYSASYRADHGVYTGKRNVTLEFFSLPDANGSLVASASTLSRIETNGQLTEAISLDRKVASVEVNPGQIVTAGSQIYLGYIARDADGNTLALSPGSAQFTLVSGADKISVGGEVATGKAGGSATVTATIDGIVSAATEVVVQPSVRVALIANPDDAEVVAFKQYLNTRNVTFTAYNDVPDAATLQNFDVMMLTGDLAQSAFINTDDTAKVKAFLDSNRGVVFFGNAPARLAGGYDTSVIASWFGGVNRIDGDRGFYGDARSTTGGKFNLPISISTGSQVSSGGEHSYYIFKNHVINPATEPVLVSAYYSDSLSAFAFEPASGGRIYWQGHPYSTNTQYSARVIDLVLAATNWAGGR